MNVCKRSCILRTLPKLDIISLLYPIKSAQKFYFINLVLLNKINSQYLDKTKAYPSSFNNKAYYAHCKVHGFTFLGLVC